MPSIIWPEVLIGIVLVAIVARLSKAARLHISEESAHAAALERKRGGEQGRGGRQSVMVMGSGDAEEPCQVIAVNRRSIRIHAARALPAGAQLQVEQGDDCFVCGIRKVAREENGYTLELDVLASNHYRRSISEAFQDGLWRFAIRMGAKERLRQRSHFMYPGKL